MPSTTAAAQLTFDPASDDLRPVAEVAESVTGRRPAPGTVWRWCQKGKTRAGRLPALRCFGRWHTTKDAFLAWVAADSQQTDAAQDDDDSDERPEHVDTKLREAGLL